MKIAIASGKGGTGKTFLTSNLFYVMKHSGLDVAVVDCDAEVPNASVFIHGEVTEEREVKMLCPEIDTTACRYCSLCADHCRFNAITCLPKLRYIKLLPDLCHGCGACLVECPHQAVRRGWKSIGKVTVYGEGNRPSLIEARLNEGEHSPVRVIREAIRQGGDSGAEYLLLDAPPGCSCPFVNTVSDADRVVLITEPTPFGLSDLRHTVKVLRQIGKPFGVVINRSDLGFDRMRSWLDEEGIPVWAEILYSHEIATCYARGETAAAHLPQFEELFTRLLQQIITHEDSHH